MREKVRQKEGRQRFGGTKRNREHNEEEMGQARGGRIWWEERINER